MQGFSWVFKAIEHISDYWGLLKSILHVESPERLRPIFYRETFPKQHFIRQCVGVNEQGEVDDTTLVEAQCCKVANAAEPAECGDDFCIAEFGIPSAECPKNAAGGEHRSLNRSLLSSRESLQLASLFKVLHENIFKIMKA